jgi:hypothetical protein
VSTSPRIARNWRYLGVAFASAALVFGAAGNAMASSIKDFSAVAECEGGKGVIRVTDVDPLGVKAEITVYLENNGADLRQVGSATIENSSAEGVTVTFEEKWKPNAEYRIHVTAGKYVDEDIAPNLIAPAEACKKRADTPPAASTSPKEPAENESEDKGRDKGRDRDRDKPSEPKSPATPPAAESTPPAGANDNNAPSPEGDSGSDSDSDLAETGSDSSTGPIAGFAAALVLLGAGAVHYSMRRRGASRR